MKALDAALVVQHEVGKGIWFGDVVEPDVDRSFDRSAEGSMVELGSKAADEAAFDQALHSSASSVRAQSDKLT